MSSIKKTIISNGREHYIQVDSSLDLEEVEITGTDPISGKTIHVSLSSLLKQPSRQLEINSDSKPLDMFSGDEIIDSSAPDTRLSPSRRGESQENSDNVINDLFD